MPNSDNETVTFYHLNEHSKINAEGLWRKIKERLAPDPIIPSFDSKLKITSSSIPADIADNYAFKTIDDLNLADEEKRILEPLKDARFANTWKGGDIYFYDDRDKKFTTWYHGGQIKPVDRLLLTGGDKERVEVPAGKTEKKLQIKGPALKGLSAIIGPDDSTGFVIGHANWGLEDSESIGWPKEYAPYTLVHGPLLNENGKQIELEAKPADYLLLKSFCRGQGMRPGRAGFQAIITDKDYENFASLLRQNPRAVLEFKELVMEVIPENIREKANSWLESEAKPKAISTIYYPRYEKKLPERKESYRNLPQVGR